MKIGLVVVQPFADYARGDRIIDPDMVQKVLAENSNSVAKISLDPSPDKPASAKE